MCAASNDILSVKHRDNSLRLIDDDLPGRLSLQTRSGSRLALLQPGSRKSHGWLPLLPIARLERNTAGSGDLHQHHTGWVICSAVPKNML